MCIRDSINAEYGTCLNNTMAKALLLGLGLLLSGASAGIKQEAFSSNDCSGASVSSFTLSECGSGVCFPQVDETVTVHSAKRDYGFGVRFSCSSVSKYLDPSPHVPGNQNSFGQDTDFSRRVVTVSMNTPASPEQRKFKHGECYPTPDGSQRYTCGSWAQDVDPSDEVQMILLISNTWRAFQPLPLHRQASAHP
eukprot:TRINITY_DN7943_c0_g1_i6.p1 TRINITY_DN7943_c0_g1~~TRINITY_DN7943_c0_g1_i6.p1  ORF type:complete len:194 (+),score=44.30 TRINITY_DN7943_c0_g1_i6:168-749(+)